MISMAFLIAALVLAVLAAISVPSGRVNLTAAALACYFVSLLAVGRAV